MKRPNRIFSAMAILSFAASGCLRTSLEEMGEAKNGLALGAKSIYAQWAGDGSAPTLDLRNYRAPATQKIRFDLEGGKACECTTGSGAGGTNLQLAQCQNAVGTTGEVGCSLLNDQYVLMQNGAVLDVCDSEGACNQFR